MIRGTMFKASIVGIAVLVLANVLWLGVLLEVRFHETLRVALYFFPGFAAFFATYLAPRRKILMGLSMGGYGAVIATLSSFVYKQIGFHIDDIGGPLATFVMLLAYHVVYCVVGTAAGYCVARLNTRKPA
jgi:hypothetical protein